MRRHEIRSFASEYLDMFTRTKRGIYSTRMCDRALHPKANHRAPAWLGLRLASSVDALDPMCAVVDWQRARRRGPDESRSIRLQSKSRCRLLRVTPGAYHGPGARQQFRTALVHARYR